MYKQSSKDIFKVLPAIIKAYINGEGRLSAIELGDRFDVNSRTLNVNLQKLVHVGILYSQRGGSNPGYGFARDPRTVSLYEIFYGVSYIEYPRCSFTEYTKGENCMICDIFSSAVDTVIANLKSVNCHEFYLSLSDKMNL